MNIVMNIVISAIHGVPQAGVSALDVFLSLPVALLFLMIFVFIVIQVLVMSRRSKDGNDKESKA